MKKQVERSTGQVPHKGLNCFKGQHGNFWLFLYVVSFLLVLPLVFKNCNHSIYFTSRRHLTGKAPYGNYLIKVDKARLASARLFFALADHKRITAALERRTGNQPSVDVVIAMVTVARSPKGPEPDMFTPEYVLESMGKLISQLTDPVLMRDFPYSVKIILCNGGMEPAQNKAALYLGMFVELITMPEKATSETEADRRENEKIDYMTCMNESLKYQPRYVLALEDDVFAEDDMWKLLNFVISEKLDRHMSRGEMVTDSDVVSVNLLHPECKLWYYKPGPNPKLELLGLSFILGTAMALIHEALSKYWYSITVRPHMNWLAWCVFVALVIIAIGRPCIVALRRYISPHFYSYSPTVKCYTPAMLYPRRGARTVIQYLNETRINGSYGKDTLIDLMISEKGMTAYELLPNAFSHIGQKSSGPDRDPYCVR